MVVHQCLFGTNLHCEFFHYSSNGSHGDLGVHEYPI